MTLIHSFITWFVANLLHSGFIILLRCINTGFQYDEFSLRIYALILIVPLLFSLPSLVLCSIVLSLIKYIKAVPFHKFFLWLLSASLLPALNLWFLIWLDKPFFGEFDFTAVIPSTFSVIISILIRYKFFFKLMNPFENINNESFNNTKMLND
jgi:hypothetical protein